MWSDRDFLAALSHEQIFRTPERLLKTEILHPHESEFTLVTWKCMISISARTPRHCHYCHVLSV